MPKRSLRSALAFFHYALPLAGCFFASAAFASDQFRFKSWTTENGLPQNSVLKVVQSPEGYLWLATFDGLARFDGLRFETFRTLDTPELPTNRLTDIFVDHEGRLWILTEDPNKIVSYFNGRFTSFSRGKDFETEDLSEPWQLTNEMVLRNGDIEYYFDGQRLQSRATTARRLPRVVWDDTETVWIDQGDHFLTGRSTELRRLDKGPDDPLRNRNLLRLDSVMIDDTLWFILPLSTTDGLTVSTLASLRDGKVARFPLPCYRGAGLQLLADKSLLLWDYENGLFRVDADTIASPDPRNFLAADLGFAPPKVLSVFRDRDENVWIGTDKGLFQWRETPPIRVYTKADGLPSENIYSVIEDRRGRIWFGAWEDHLVRFENEKFFSEPYALVGALFEDRNSRLWAANSVLRYLAGNDWVPLDPSFRPAAGIEINVIEEDGVGNLWFGGPELGIARFDGRSTRRFTVADGLPADSVTAFHQTRDGTIWVGTVNGLAYLDGERFVAKRLTEAGGGYVRSLYEDKDGTLWIGTYDTGIIRFRDGEFRVISTDQGLFSNGVFCIIEDDEGWFWMNSNQGIHRALRDELNAVADGTTSRVTSISYGPEDGLTNVEGNGGKQPAALKASDGRIWFPTAGGLAVVDPKKIHKDEKAPEVLIEEVMVDNKELSSPLEELRVAPGQNALEINYTGIKFNNPDGIRFRYMLEGLENDWTEAGTRRTAYFSHLPYGEYTFRVLAANRDGVWNEQGAALKVIIERPFYRTYLFFGFVALLVVGTFGLVYVARVRQLRNLAEARELYARQLLESQERERSRLAMEVHDSIGQSLVIIRNRALLAISKSEDRAALVEQVKEISDASATALEEAREIAHTLHPYQIEALGLTTALRSLMDKFERSSGIYFDVTMDAAPDVLPEVAIGIYRIVQEWLTNIAKHSRATEVTVKLTCEGDRLMLKIEDNGVGFEPADVRKGLGLKSIEERCRMMEGSIKIVSSPGKGATLLLTVGRDLPNG